MELTPALCALLGEKAEQKSIELGVSMVIALADARGELVYFSRMPSALPASNAIAVSKAYTAAVLRMPTEQVGALARPGEKLEGIQNNLDRSIVLFGGGRPLTIKGRIIGAVGISGGCVEEDICVAETVEKLCSKMTDFVDRTAFLASLNMNWTTASARRLRQVLDTRLPENDAEQIEALAGAILLSTGFSR